jgi:hypothetical protein
MRWQDRRSCPVVASGGAGQLSCGRAGAFCRAFRREDTGAAAASESVRGAGGWAAFGAATAAVGCC